MTGKEYQELAIRTCSIPYDQKEDRLPVAPAISKWGCCSISA